MCDNDNYHREEEDRQTTMTGETMAQREGSHYDTTTRMTVVTTVMKDRLQERSDDKKRTMTSSLLVMMTRLTDWWRQIWRAAGRESGSPELLESPRKFPELPRKVSGDFPGTSLTVDLNSNLEVPQSQTCPEVLDFPGSSPDFPRGPKKHINFFNKFFGSHPPPPPKKNTPF